MRMQMYQIWNSWNNRLTYASCIQSLADFYKCMKFGMFVDYIQHQTLFQKLKPKEDPTL